MNELARLSLILGLLVVPRALQRFKVPAPLTCLLFGIIAMLWLGDNFRDQVVDMLAIIGISTLFLFAGLEVDLQSLRREMRPLLFHLAIRVLLLCGFAWVSEQYLDKLIPGLILPWQAYGLLALGLLTSSTGFIIDTINRLGLNKNEQFWVINKAIAAEFLALGALFVLLQIGDTKELAISSAGLLALIIILPLFFLALGRWVVPHSPGSEFSLLVMVGIMAAYSTYKLGAYYLVGAFIAGLTASMLQKRMPLLASHDNLNAVRLFASFFVPFYFFNAGIRVPTAALTVESLKLGLILTAIVLPFRLLEIWLQRRAMFKTSEGTMESFRISLALSPTLVFTLVLAAILQKNFAIPDQLFGALLLYAALTTILPSLVFRSSTQAKEPQTHGIPVEAIHVPDSNHSDAVTAQQLTQRISQQQVLILPKNTVFVLSEDTPIAWPNNKVQIHSVVEKTDAETSSTIHDINENVAMELSVVSEDKIVVEDSNSVETNMTGKPNSAA